MGLGVIVQSRQIRSLHGEQRQRLADLDQSSLLPAEASSTPAELASEIPSELLRLRNEVSRLSARKRELSGVQAENEKLRAQLAEHRTNNPTGTKLPPGYIRKSQARLVGYKTPEDTIQSFLWVLQNHDAAGLAQALVPAESGGRFPIDNPELLFSRAQDIFGMRIFGRSELVDGTIELQVQLTPGVIIPEAIGLKQIAGEWKILWLPF